MILSQLVQHAPSDAAASDARRLSSPQERSVRAGTLHPARTSLELLHDPVASEMLLIEDFLSTEKCEAILSELDFTLWRPGLTYMLQTDV